MRIRGIIVAGLCALVCPPAAVAAVEEGDPSAMLAILNDRRAEDGLPPLALDAKMTQGCRNHTLYKLLNDGQGGHDEDPTKPGSTPLGRKAAQRSNLGNRKLAGHRLYDFQPIHRYGVLDPRHTKAGLAESTEGTRTEACYWTAGLDADDQYHVRTTPSATRWSAPGPGTTGVRTWEASWESSPILPFQTGFSTSSHGPFLSGNVLMLWQAQEPGVPDLNRLCQGVLLGPGGIAPRQAVPRASLNVVVPAEPLLPGATYRHVSTIGETWADPPCGAVQRTHEATFRTAAYKSVGQLVRITGPHPGAEAGHQVARVAIADELSFLADANGTMVHRRFPDGQPEPPPWTYRDGFWRFGGADHGLTYSGDHTLHTIAATNDRLQFGPICYPPTTITRSFRRDGATVTATGPQSVSFDASDPCVAPPQVGAPPAGAVAPGAVVRIPGQRLRTAVDVRVGSVKATRWRFADADGALLLTVPPGAQTGAVTVRTPLGQDASSAPLTIKATDDAPPTTVLLLGPSGSGGPSTASFAWDAEPGATTHCRIDGGAFTPCTSPWVRTGLGEGPHAFTVRATDAAGNVEPSPPTRSWVVGPAPATGGDPAPGGGTTGGPPPNPPAGGGEPVAEAPPGETAPAAGATGGGEPTGTTGGGSSPTATARPVAPLLRAGPVSLIRAKPLRITRRRFVVGTLRSSRAAKVTVEVRRGTRRIARVSRRLRRGRPSPLRITLPRHAVPRGTKRLRLTVVLRTGSRRASTRVTVPVR